MDTEGAGLAGKTKLIETFQANNSVWMWVGCAHAFGKYTY
jgi:hypothetical protein